MRILTENLLPYPKRIVNMRKDILEKKEYLRNEQASKDIRFVAYRGNDKDGKERDCIIKLCDNRVERIDVFGPEEMETGSVYLGRIENENKNISASFADIGLTGPVFVPGSHKPGTELPLMIKTLPYKTKLAKASDKIPAKIAGAVFEKAAHSVKGSLLYKAPGPFEKSLKEVCETDKAKWITEDQILYERALNICGQDERIVMHEADISLCALYGLSTKISRVFSPKVDLKSGAQIVIAETEAMCVIDVNSAKAVKGGDREETFLKINLEAGAEICAQIAARNLGGIILIDFISMKDAESETILLEDLRLRLEMLDPPAKLEDITKLGIVEISRKRLKGSLSLEKAFVDSTILIK